jgi:hypothetical protein
MTGISWAADASAIGTAASFKLKPQNGPAQGQRDGVRPSWCKRFPGCRASSIASDGAAYAGTKKRRSKRRFEDQYG